MSTTVTPLRYPGGKSAFTGFLARLVTANSLRDPFYVEPYCGGAGAAVSLLLNEVVSDIFLNDVDRAIYSFWKATLVHTDTLCERIQKIKLTVSEWQRQRRILLQCNKHPLVDVGFACLFLNRVNRSGVLRANPIGGLAQDGDWRMDARFNREDLVRKIQRIARYRNRIHVFNLDAETFLARKVSPLSRQSLIYLDPPYFEKGKCLYRNHYQHEDHKRLADYLQSWRHKYWVVSYDAVPEVYQLYKNLRRLTYQLSYSAARRYSGSEVAFFSPALQLPSEVNPFMGSERIWNGRLFTPRLARSKTLKAESDPTF